MHPLELQVKDLKATIELKDKRLKILDHTLRSLSKELEEIKEMLHPSRQKHIDVLKQKVDTSLGG